MKGLREMTDERNRNWEVALKKMAAYIVNAKHGGKAVMDHKAVGPLVGEALELIGAQLVDDAIDFSPIRETPASQSTEAAILALEADAAAPDLDQGVGPDQGKTGVARGTDVPSAG
jgi:hypothetical protein